VVTHPRSRGVPDALLDLLTGDGFDELHVHGGAP
jgi:hypothetical protein